MPIYNYAFANGKTAIQGYGDRWQIAFQGTWTLGDVWSVAIVSTAGDFNVGQFNFSGLPPSYTGASAPNICFTLANRVYLGLGQQFNFSDNFDPTGWEVQNPGAGTIGALTQYSGQDTVNGFASYQGLLGVFLRNTIQIWAPNADPTQFAIKQNLTNIGTRFAQSIQSLGDFDVLFLADSGFRSLRVRDLTLNAGIVDIGTPVDSLLQAALAAYTPGTNAPPCGVVDPNTGRYWCFVQSGSGGSVDNTIYVLSKYDSSKIAAWSTYKPTYKDGSGNQQTFVPSKFLVFQGVVYARGTDQVSGNDYLITYGPGYDNAVATVQLPWLSSKTPTVLKTFLGCDFDMVGTWAFSFGFDSGSATYVSVESTATPTFDGYNLGLSGQGTHWSMKCQTTGSEAAQIGNLSVHYDLEE